MSEMTGQLEDFVFDALVEFGAEREEVNREATLEGLDIDSLDIVELGQMIEEEYGVRLNPEEFRGVRTVGDALDIIGKHVG